jgi:hypothetical protein
MGKNSQPRNQPPVNVDNSAVQAAEALPLPRALGSERLHAVEELIHCEQVAIQARAGLCAAKAFRLLYRQRPELAVAWHGKEMALKAMPRKARRKWLAEAKRRYKARMAEFAARTLVKRVT